MFGLGSGKSSCLHNPDYDFPDDIILTGINLFHQISKQILNAHSIIELNKNAYLNNIHFLRKILAKK
jgi:hypothetical protein